jgi:hypothetical protein
MRTGAILALALAASFAATAPALAWDIFSFPDAHFAAQFPAQPRMDVARYRTTKGLDVPALRYIAQEDNVAYVRLHRHRV